MRNHITSLREREREREKSGEREREREGSESNYVLLLIDCTK